MKRFYIILVLMIFIGCGGSGSGDSFNSNVMSVSIQEPIIENLKVTFKAGVDNAGNILEYEWNFGDGDSSNEETPTHIYSKGGIYKVQLIVDSIDTSTSALAEKSIVVPTGLEIKPINLFMYKGDLDPNYMYFAVHVEGTSETGKFFQPETDSIFGKIPDAYPRDMQFQICSSSNSVCYVNFKSDEIDDLCKLGYCIKGYSDVTGFANASGTVMDMPFYLGHDDFHIRINGNDDIEYSFINFVVQDLSAVVWQGYAAPVFLRFNQSHPFKVTVPMSSYNPSIHKNIAKITAHFISDSAGYHYFQRFDGFELK